MNIFRKKYFLFRSSKNRINLYFHNKYGQYSRKLQGKVNYLIKRGVFSLIGNYLRTSKNSKQLISNINAVVLIVLFC